MATREDALDVAQYLTGTLRDLFVQLARTDSGMAVLQGEFDRFTFGNPPGNPETAKLVALAYVRRQRLAVTGPLRDRTEEFLLRSARGRIPEPKPPNNISAAVHVTTGDPYPDWGGLVRQHEQLSPPMASSLHRAWDTTAAAVAFHSFARAIQAARGLTSGQYITSFAERFVTDMAKVLVGHLVNGAAAGMRGAVSAPSAVFLDTATQRSHDWASQYAASLIRDITDEQERTFRGLVSRAFEDGVGSEELAWRLRENGLGLHQRYTTAVDNYYRGMLEDGVARGVARDRSRLYAAHLRDVRADTIARTEVMYALNWGRLELWNAAVQHDDLSTDIGKRWVTALDERVCPICRPLNNVVVGLYDHFELPLSVLVKSQQGKLFIPPAHPQCRCTVVLYHPDARMLPERMAA